MQHASPSRLANSAAPIPPVAVADELSVAVGARGFAADRQSTIPIGDLVVDLTARTVSANGKPVPLTGSEYRVLELLALRRNTAVTKEMLLDHLYGTGDEPEIKIIDVFVCYLRKKLARATGGKHHIETVWGRGYRLRDPG